MKNTVTRTGYLALAAGTAMVLGYTPAVVADETIALKNALYGAGYNIVNVDSGMDDATRSELSRFQKDNGLQANGILDEATEKALGMINVQVAAVAPSRQPENVQSTAGKSKPAEEGVVKEKEGGGWSLF